jgi:exopolyphosphatase/pppGpp-phosphohydrolase
VLETLVEELELDAITVSEWGLREGVILEALGLARSDRRVGSSRS